jgi:hypothetical protein
MVTYIILFAHWLADFVYQTDSMAQNKSKSMLWLSIHTVVYSLVIGALLFNPAWALYNGLAHFVVDYFTSKLNKKLWEDKEVHWFFVSVGFDQLLHTACLLLTWGWF